MISKDGYSNIVAAFIIGGVIIGLLSYINHWAATIGMGIVILLFLGIVLFFRDPDRSVPEDPNLILAPADGKIVHIKKVDEPDFLKGPATQISIFLSPLDVHVNRVPATGSVDYVQYQPGKYLMAWDERASTMNERADFGLTHPTGTKLFFRQITGFMARRIVYHLSKGDMVTSGERFGIMKFGSRMDVLLPLELSLAVSEGQQTVAGETVLATIESTQP